MNDLVFISYSHTDRDWLRRLLVLLTPVVRTRRLEIWADEYIEVGNDWRRDFTRAVGRSRAAVLLVTGDYLASRFIMDEELPALQAAGVRLVPALVHECLWDIDPALAEMQWAHDPGRDGPLDLHSDRPGERDRRLTGLCRRLLELIPSEPKESVTPHPTTAAKALPAAPLQPASDEPAPLDGVPPLPLRYVSREELAGVRSALIDRQQPAVGLTGEVPGIGLAGQGGIGKTVLATAIARDPEIARFFPDGVFWVTLGETADILSAQVDLLGRLGVGTADVRGITHGAAALKEALRDRRCLLVVDDVWSSAATSAFAAVGPRGRVLYTTRIPAVLASVGAHVEHVDVLSVASARELLGRLTDTDPDLLPSEVDSVMAATGRAALPVALVGAAVRGGVSWVDALVQLGQGARTFGDHPYANAFKALQLGVGALSEPVSRAYFSLAAYPPDTRVPVAAIARFWGQLYEYDLPETESVIAELVGRRLLTHDAGTVGFHDLQHDYLLLEVDHLELLHADLLAAYHALLPANGSWWQLPPDEPYIWDHLLHHMYGAGQTADLSRIATDPAYLMARAFHGGTHAAESDLRAAGRLAPDDRIRWWQRWFAQYGHLLSNLPSISDVAATAMTRLQQTPQGIDPSQLLPVLGTEHVEPVWGLTPPSQELLRVLTGHTDVVRGVAFSPDGHLLATTGYDRTVRLWDPAGGDEVRTLTGHTDEVNGVAFSPGGRLLASTSDDKTVRIWDSASGAEVRTLTGHDNATWRVAFSPDGLMLATSSADSTVRLWDPASGDELRTLVGHTNAVWGVTFSPDGLMLATASYDHTVRLWDPATGDELRTLTGHTDEVNGVAFSPDGHRLATASDDKTVRIWDPATGDELRTLTAHTDAAWGVAFSPDGELLATTGRDETVRLWDPATGEELRTLTGHTNVVWEVAFAPGGHLLATTSADQTARLWDARHRGEREAITGHADWVRGLAFAPDGDLLVTASGDETVRLWDPATGEELRTLTGHTAVLWGVAFAPDGHLIATASGDGTARIWDPATGDELLVLTGHTNAVWGVAFSPDGHLLATSSADQTVRLWDPATGDELRSLTGHTNAVWGVAFSPVGHLLATTSYDHTVRLWDPTTGDELRTLTGHTDEVNGVTFSPDGRLLATASDDTTVRIWDPASGDELGVLTGHSDAVWAVAFSPDGQLLATTSRDETVRLWRPGGDPTGSTALKIGSVIPAIGWHGSLLAVAAGRSVVLFTVVRTDA